MTVLNLPKVNLIKKYWALDSQELMFVSFCTDPWLLAITGDNALLQIR